MKIKLYQRLERIFSRLETWAGAMRERVAICPHCGRNRYSGEPCVQYAREQVDRPNWRVK